MREGGILKAGRAQSELVGFVQIPQLKTQTPPAVLTPHFSLLKPH